MASRRPRPPRSSGRPPSARPPLAPEAGEIAAVTSSAGSSSTPSSTTRSARRAGSRSARASLAARRGHRREARDLGDGAARQQRVPQPFALIDIRRGHPPGERTHPSHVRGSLGHPDSAPGVEQVERVRALQDHLKAGDHQAGVERPLRLALVDVERRAARHPGPRSRSCRCSARPRTAGRCRRRSRGRSSGSG